MEKKQISGRLIDVHSRNIYPAIVTVAGGRIERIEGVEHAPDIFILPGLIDSHIHIESSMITPGSFARAAVSRGTIGVVSDPHEIANVLGMDGVKFMIEDSKTVPLKFFFGAPSCVPATTFERSGGTLDHKQVKELLDLNEIKFLSEMMNFPGVINDDPEVLKKISYAKAKGKPVDGHAPGLRGDQLKKYVMAGITTDHECSTIEEAKEKIALGMKVIIREGSAARNLDALKDLFKTDPEMIMLCSDDLHPEMLAKRHMNKIVSRLVNEGYDLFDVLRSCTVNPAEHYKLDVGLLQPGQPADFILVDHYNNMNVIETWINGVKVYANGNIFFNYDEPVPLNKFNCSPIRKEDIQVFRSGEKMRVILAYDKELFTGETIVKAPGFDYVKADPEQDILKIIVKDRYDDSPPVVGFIRGFGLKEGAFASSVAHDSHNIICVGSNDEDIVQAINEIVKLRGGLSVSSAGKTSSLQLRIAGIMSEQSCETIASAYEGLSLKVQSLGCNLSAPYMTLSFMALLVIPELKIGDKGLFDVNQFTLVSLFE